MKMLLSSAAVVAASSSLYAGMYQTVTIDFDDLAGGFPPVQTDGLFSPHATFSTQEGHVLLVFAGAGVVGGSNPNTLTAAESVDASTFDSDIYIDFANAARNVSIDILSDNDSGVVAGLRVIHGGGIAELDIVGNGDFSDPIPTDLSAYSDVTRIELFGITDEFGLSIDNLVFETLVPTPGAVAMFGLAGWMGLSRRRG